MLVSRVLIEKLEANNQELQEAILRIEKKLEKANEKLDETKDVPVWKTTSHRYELNPENMEL